VSLSEHDLELTRAEAQRRIDRRDRRARLLERVHEIVTTVEQIDRLLATGVPLAASALGLQREALLDERTTNQIEINSTSTRSWGGPDELVRARDGEGIVETTWRVLLDHGAGSKRIATLTGADDRRMRHWRAKMRAEIHIWLNDLRALRFPWTRTRELIADAEAMLRRLQ
jgi:hypothetical protein